ncbi:MAG: urease accessory protein UreD [Actinomycetota bacterium]|nr:urease accessory protein UreD [Actinomycetota bacterium]
MADVRARARLRIERSRSGPSVAVDQRDSPPLAFRRCVDGIYYLVATAAGPLGTDDVAIDIEVGAGAVATVRALGATLAYASSTARLSLRVLLDEHAILDWWPGPLIATARCALAVTTEAELAATASLRLREELVLGRHNERPGRLHHRLSAQRGRRPLLRHELRIGPDSPGWDGPAVLGPARALAMALQVDPGRPATSANGEGWARLALAAGGELALALGRDLGEARARLDRVAVPADPTARKRSVIP